MQINTSFSPESINCAYPVIKETIPQSKLGYNTNNKYPEFPPLMSDSRSITASWQHDAVTNAKIIEENNIQSNWQYRQYLTKNAINVMQDNFLNASNDLGYHSRNTETPNVQSNEVNGYSTPALYTNVLEEIKPLGYSISDLKTTYLTREQLNARKISPAIPQDVFIQPEISNQKILSNKKAQDKVNTKI
tara:strand:- start:1312 stop:1881 length:570 start_codon:yes stop_codon:yes gene_type:complete